MIKLENQSYSILGVLFWKTNDRPVPMSFFAENDLVAPEGQQQANDSYVAESLKEYRANAAKGPSDEDRAEARAVHGAGVTLVNIITGEKWTT